MDTNEQHTSYMNGLKEALAAHTDLPSIELLAVTAQFIGNLIALQDSTQYTTDGIMLMVSRNIQIGNMVAINRLSPGKVN
jgi:hypothetical protein